ncbi:MAG TPA: hypothetical protein VN493_13610 [Thermoanaerobaculia bacterium]|nr:hypothetical protein [Thermoanaerobaculia bacterium]
MSRRLACALLVLWSASALGQEAPRPDFSGTWKLDKGKSSLQAPAPDTSILYIDHSDPRLLLTRAHVLDGEADLFRILVLTDGKDDVKKWREHRTVNRCRWEGDKLILESREREGRKESLTVMELSLSPDGKTLTAEERLTGPGRKYENTLVLQRETTPPTLDVTETDLAEIKAAVLKRYGTREPGLIGEGFEGDLQRGALFPAEEGRGPSIGIWELTLKEGRLALIRQPTDFEPPVMVYFGFYLAKLDGRWVVLDTYLLEERISFVEEE